MPKSRKVEPELSARAKQLLAQMRAASDAAHGDLQAFDLPAASEKVRKVLMATFAALDNEITVREGAIISRESDRVLRAMREYVQSTKKRQAHPPAGLGRTAPARVRRIARECPKE